MYFRFQYWQYFYKMRKGNFYNNICLLPKIFTIQLSLYDSTIERYTLLLEQYPDYLYLQYTSSSIVVENFENYPTAIQHKKMF